jgi:hypothetical protein
MLAPPHQQISVQGPRGYIVDEPLLVKKVDVVAVGNVHTALMKNNFYTNPADLIFSGRLVNPLRCTAHCPCTCIRECLVRYLGWCAVSVQRRVSAGRVLALAQRRGWAATVIKKVVVDARCSPWQTLQSAVKNYMPIPQHWSMLHCGPLHHLPLLTP